MLERPGSVISALAGRKGNEGAEPAGGKFPQAEYHRKGESQERKGPKEHGVVHQHEENLSETEARSENVQKEGIRGLSVACSYQQETYDFWKET